MMVKLDFTVRCECGVRLYAKFHEEYNRGVTEHVIVVEPCSDCKESNEDSEEKGDER